MKEEVTHGQVIELLFHTRCEVIAKNNNGIQVHLDMVSQHFASFFCKYWPSYYKVHWFDFDQNWNIYPASG